MNAEQQTAEPINQGFISEKHAQGRNSDEGQKQEQASEAQRKRKRMLLVFTVVLVAAGLGGLMYWLHARHYEDTDDAQIDGNLSPIGTRIDGTVVRVYVQNNQRVKVGDPLVDLDPHD